MKQKTRQNKRARFFKSALLLAGVVLGAQLIGAYHSHEAHAATEHETETCSVCQLGHELKTIEAVQSPSDFTVPVQSLKGTDSIDFILPHEVPADGAPRAPPAYL